MIDHSHRASVDTTLPGKGSPDDKAIGGGLKQAGVIKSAEGG